MKTTALIVVDVQKDFLPGGALGVDGGRLIIPTINRMMAEFATRGALVIATRDWHPAYTPHFDKWPVHCVENSKGAEFADELEFPDNLVTIFKGRYSDGYSAFDGLTDAYVGLHNLLQQHHINTIWVCGIATDYCVKATALDARKLGYSVFLIVNAIAGVAPETTEQALHAMSDSQVMMVRTGDLPGQETLVTIP